MPESEQHFGTYPIAFNVGEPMPTWCAMSPLVGSGQITTGSYSVITPVSIELASVAVAVAVKITTAAIIRGAS